MAPPQGRVVVHKDRIGWPSALLILLAVGFVGTYWFVVVPMAAAAIVVTAWSRRQRR